MAPAPSEDAAKQRIISHMNADHQDSVIRYAEFYGNSSRFASRNAKLVDVALDKLVVDANGKHIIIPLNPSMGSLKDARERLVDMDKKAVTGLGRSPITLKEYIAPKGFQIVIFAACVWTFVSLSRKENMVPGHFIHDKILGHVPPLNDFSLKWRDYILWPTIAIHLTEVYIMTGRLKKHSVPVFSRVWWSWIVSCFIEGFGTFQRISAYEKAKIEKQAKH